MTWFSILTNPLHGECASEGCLNPPSWRLEAGGVGSEYCHNCKANIEKLVQRAAYLRGELERLAKPPKTIFSTQEHRDGD